jgi:4a-hydroxytetrahydrobiopterin dehydratase
MTEKLTQQQIADQLAILNEGLAGENIWQIKSEKLVKTFKFKNFIRAFGWMSQIAICAEKLNHHPEWFNVYNTVKVELTTHDVKGISHLDFKLANKMQLFAA